MKRLSSLTLLSVQLLLSGAVADDTRDVKLNLSTAHKGTVEIDTALLNQAPQTRETQAFFAAARRAFGEHPMSSFAERSEVREAAVANGVRLLGGPMLGAVSHEGGRVWVRTRKPSNVTVLVQVGENERRFGPVASTVTSDLTAVVPISGLQPDTRYSYRVLVDGEPVPMPAGATILTTPCPGAATRMTIAFGADFHKTGLWNRALLDRIRTRENRAFLLLGDSAVDDRDNRVGLHRSDYLLRDLSPGWRELASSLPIYATWDDHDYFNNDRSGIPPRYTDADRVAVRRVWTQCWNNPSYGFDDRELGIFFHTRLGPCDLIMLDTRSRRTTKGEPDCYLGTEQMRWLEKELVSCTAPFIILTSGTMWSDYVSAGKDSWGVWDPPARERILSLVEEKGVGGVILLSGDRHGARVMRIERPSGFTFWEFELGSLGAHPGPGPMGGRPELQPFGEVRKTFFGECTFDTMGDDPTATVRVVDPDGEVHYEVTLTRSQLTPRKRP
jgi:alkaline phosphatase D